jgi:hypothetical protein
MTVWENDDDGQARIAFAQHADDGCVSASITTADNAELPSAAVTSDQLFVAYISKVNKRHEIWLARQSYCQIVKSYSRKSTHLENRLLYYSTAQSLLISALTLPLFGMRRRYQRTI